MVARDIDTSKHCQKCIRIVREYQGEHYLATGKRLSAQINHHTKQHNPNNPD